MKKEHKITVGIAEDHELVREALIPALENTNEIKVVFDVSNGLTLLEALKQNTPDIILLDIDMPVMSGKEAMRFIRKDFPNVKVMVLTSHFSRREVIDFVKQGACAFLPKTSKKNVLIEAIKNVFEKGSYFDTDVSAILAKELAAFDQKQTTNTIPEFNDLELRIIKLVCQNKISKEIAEDVNLDTRTVEYHRAKIMKRINAKNVSELIYFAVRNNLVGVF